MSDSNNALNSVSNLGPQLEAAVRSVISEPLDIEAIARVKARASMLSTESAKDVVVLKLDPAMSAPLHIPFLSWSPMMRCLSTAAVISVVVGATLLFQSSPSAFGEVMQQIRSAKSFSFTKLIYQEGKNDPIEVKEFVAEDGRRRSEQGGVTTIMDSTPRIRLSLLGITKTALVYEAIDSAVPAAKHEQLKWLDDLKSHSDKPDEKLGTKTLDGRSVEGFLVKQGLVTYSVWIDAESRELVSVENEPHIRGTNITKVVMTKFRFNEKLDESLFSFDVPEGYKTSKQKMPSLEKFKDGETSIVEALRGFTKRSSGKFPKSISEWGEWVLLVAKESKDGSLDDQAKDLMSYLGSILPFLSTMAKENYEYLGEGKTVEDNRCIIFWYRDKNSKLRAIYNDLKVSDVEEKDLPNRQ